MAGLVLQRTPLRMDDGQDRRERRERAKIRIGDDVIITILGVHGYQVRVHIEAPKHVAIHREEIYQRIKKEVGEGAPIPAHPSYQEEQAPQAPQHRQQGTLTRLRSSKTL